MRLADDCAIHPTPNAYAAALMEQRGSPDTIGKMNCLGLMSDTQPVIRAAEQRDVDVIAALGRRFFEEAEWSDVTTWDDESIRLTLGNLVDSDDGILIVCEIGGEVVGMAGGLVHPAYFNMHHRTGQELFWWVSPEHRRGVGARLLDRMEYEAGQRGADSFAMIALAKVRPEAVGRVYERRGYRPSERSYIKALV